MTIRDLGTNNVSDEADALREACAAQGHEPTTSYPWNCYTVKVCTKCGIKWAWDSSD